MVFSSKEQLEQIASYLCAYMRIPYFQDDSIPGEAMEQIISLVHKATKLKNYDYVDVCIQDKVGWSVKSTKQKTPLTWKRAKIANSSDLIKKSKKSKKDCQILGNKIIDFCNEHAAESIKKHKLKKIGYSRLILNDDGTATYFEKLLCTDISPSIFNQNDFYWEWSTPKKTTKKEQLPALHGLCVNTNKKIFSWHGQGENQLHFSGEDAWWPNFSSIPSEKNIVYSKDNHAIKFCLPKTKVSWDDLIKFLYQ